MEKEIKAGDVVFLKSGGKPMTVNKIHDNGQVDCVWMLADGKFEHATLYLDAIALKGTVSRPRMSQVL